MAIVKDQQLPTDSFEDTLAPPIEALDQYQKTLSEGIDHPKLPAGEEVVTFNKRESRPAQRSNSKYFNKPESEAWRSEFKDCLACWARQPPIDSEQDECHSAISKHQVRPWHYVAGGPSTQFNNFMRDCLDYRRAHPDAKLPRCEDLTITPNPFTYCPDDIITFEVPNGNEPMILSTDCGSIAETLQLEIPADPEEAPPSCTVYFTDSEGRKGCAQGERKQDEDCPCVNNPPSLQIGYTSLQMQCSEQQLLFADMSSPGVPPYLWAIIEGGGSLSANSGENVIYTAPATNQGCTDNPTITLTDKCNQLATIQLAISSCLNFSTICAYRLYTHENVYGEGYGWEYGQTICGQAPTTWFWLCLMWEEHKTDGLVCIGGQKTGCGTGCAGEEGAASPQLWQTAEGGGAYAPDVTNGFCFPGCEGIHFPYPHMFTVDMRDALMIQDGCCPINPYTGLPF